VVLVVEDRDDLYEAYSDELADAGFSVEGAIDQQQAIASARRLKPNLVLLVVRISGIGNAIARNFMADPEMQHVSIVALTADTARAGFVPAIEAQLQRLRMARST